MYGCVNGCETLKRDRNFINLLSIKVDAFIDNLVDVSGVLRRF